MVSFQQKKSSWLISNVSIRFILLQTIFFGLAICWLGSTGRSPWGGSLAPSWQWPRSRSTVQAHYDNLHSAFTWSFHTKARLEPAESWKDVQDSRKTWQGECLCVASVITVEYSIQHQTWKNKYCLDQIMILLISVDAKKFMQDVHCCWQATGE